MDTEWHITSVWIKTYDPYFREPEIHERCLIAREVQGSEAQVFMAITWVNILSYEINNTLSFIHQDIRIEK